MQVLIVILAAVVGIVIAALILIRPNRRNRGITTTELTRWFRKGGR